ncbi:acetyltransferase [Paenibacillus eucommiae]|uniref:Sugar O-acyltransferase (Sialic acid O-acetyltransferase NeuD family) n=1 Tax=Paenibacillus eucommiae TaxID=1355755 RepID=A0ABS4IX71_9BACL|nr:acetyltransferase [Paenibacillus eucommiae]MBP1991139.1 sugar O-acyltransferase (sialic acid O-acetyltransferase NeuD family) [Paenibacillus eucommiae]
MIRNIIIFGIGDFAELVYYYFKNCSDYNVVAFTVNKLYINTEKYLGVPIVAFEDIEKKYPVEENDMFIAIGYSKVNKIRRDKFLEAKQKGYNLASFISSNAIVAENATIGANSFILEGVIIQPFVCIGDAVILWSGCHVGHHSTVNNYCFLAPSTSLSGYVTINELSFIGNGAIIRDSVIVGKENVIGAGVVILNNTNDKSVYKSSEGSLLGITSDQLRSI